MKDSCLYNSDRFLYESIIKKLKEFDDNSKLAFASKFYKPITYIKINSKIKIPLLKLKSEDIEKNKDSEIIKNNSQFYNDLLKKLKDNNDDPYKAFPEHYYQPDFENNLCPIVYTVKIVSKKGINGMIINNGIAQKENMVRVDVFKKTDKNNNSQYFIIPIYAEDMIKTHLPDKAIKPNCTEDNWHKIDKSFHFLFSLFSNDLIRIVKENGEERIGYYKSCNRHSGVIIIHPHYKNITKKELKVEFSYQNALIFEKYQVDLLGNYYQVRGEKRLPLIGQKGEDNGVAESGNQ